MKTPIVVFGAGGHARVIVALLRRLEAWDLVAVLDRQAAAAGENIDGIPVHGPFADASRHFATGVRHAALAVGDNAERAQLLGTLTAQGWTLPALRHPAALVEDNVQLLAGCVICAGAILAAQVVVGRGAIINTGAIVDHESQVGECAHVAPGCAVAGRVRIGAGAMVGIGSSVREKISIGANSQIGAGSVVVEDIPPGVVAYGVPARVARERAP